MTRLLRRGLYFGYYLRKLDWVRLDRFMAYVRNQNGWSRAGQWRRFIRDSLRFNISILEYYQFRFFELEDAEKATWAGTGTMFEFHRRMNPPAARGILADKRQFYHVYREYCRHQLWSLQELAEDPALVERILAQNEKLVFKDAGGNCGASVRIQAANELSAPELTGWMADCGFDMVESFIQQHPDLQSLSPSGVNTVRIFTCLDKQDRCLLLGCRLRISVNSPVDNMAAGNLAAPVDEETGRVCGPGVYSDITRPPEAVHPVTGIPIEGFQIPFWREILAMVRDASEHHPQNRSIGWDVVVTPDGPGLLEGNHDWCKLVWQLPVGRGLKHRLECCQ